LIWIKVGPDALAPQSVDEARRPSIRGCDADAACRVASAGNRPMLAAQVVEQGGSHDVDVVPVSAIVVTLGAAIARPTWVDGCDAPPALAPSPLLSAIQVLDTQAQRAAQVGRAMRIVALVHALAALTSRVVAWSDSMVPGRLRSERPATMFHCCPRLIGQPTKHGAHREGIRFAAAVATMLSILAAGDVPAQARTYYVATNGNDSWSGTIASPAGGDGPFRTIGRAQGAVRSALTSSIDGAVLVLIRSGDYYQDSPLYFSPQDSGHSGGRVVYRGYPGERPVLHRARRLTAWQAEPGGIYKSPADWEVNALWENGVRAFSARHPNAIPGKPPVYSRTSAAIAGADTNKFGFRTGDIPVVANPVGLEVVIWPGGPDGVFNWLQQVFSVSHVDYAAGVLTLGREASSGATSAAWAIGAGSRYFVQGAREFLDSPGEFWHGGGFLYYRPRQLPIESLEILVPGPSQQHNEGIVSVVGTGTANMVHDIEFEGLALAFTSSPGSGFFVRDAERVSIRGNHVHDVGGHGITVHGASRDNAVAGNLIHHVGLDGVNLYGEASIGNPLSNMITNNHIHHVGQVRGDSNGISLNRGSHNVVSRNRIHDAPREGIGAFGSLHLVPPVQDAAGNSITFNDISRAMTDSQDGAPIHVGGIGPGNSISDNRIHHSDLAFSYGNGIYLDVTNLQTTIRGNVLHDLQQAEPDGITYAGIHVKGEGTAVINNVIVGNRLNSAAVHVVATAPSEAHLPTRDTTVVGNVFAQNRVSNVYAFPEFDEPQLGRADYNLFHDANGVYTVGYTWDAIASTDPRQETLAEWRQRHGHRHDQNSVAADPRFVDFERRDFRLRPESPAYALGFEDIDHAAMGLAADFPFADPTEPLDRLFVTTQRSGASATVRLQPGERVPLIVKGRTLNGYLVSPSVAELRFWSAAPEIATVDAQGTLTARALGLANISVSSTAGGAPTATILFVHVVVAPPADRAEAIEYRHAAFDHYFVTTLADEIAKLDAGTFPGWTRTGQAIHVLRGAGAGGDPVCRFFSTAFGQKSSHFYTPDPTECETVKNNPDWQYEGVVFAMSRPDAAGRCRSGSAPVYRLYNQGQGAAPNHRYTTNRGVREQMLHQGWLPEGYGTDGVAMCAPL
jgi:hypothetical protein